MSTPTVHCRSLFASETPDTVYLSSPEGLTYSTHWAYLIIILSCNTFINSIFFVFFLQNTSVFWVEKKEKTNIIASLDVSIHRLINGYIGRG